MDILIIGTNHSNRIQYASLFSGNGYRVREALNYQDAQNALETQELPHTVVIDLKLNAPHAAEFTTMLREHYRDMRVVVVGGNDHEARTLYASGADSFLYRPVTSQDLLDNIID